MEKKSRRISCRVSATGACYLFFAIGGEVYRWDPTDPFKTCCIYGSDEHILKMKVRSSAVAGSSGIKDTHLFLYSNKNTVTLLDINHHSTESFVVYSYKAPNQVFDAFFFENLLFVAVYKNGVMVFELNSSATWVVFTVPGSPLCISVNDDYLDVLCRVDVISDDRYGEVDFYRYGLKVLKKRSPCRPLIVPTPQPIPLTRKEGDPVRYVVVKGGIMYTLRDMEILVQHIDGLNVYTTLVSVGPRDGMIFYDIFFMGSICYGVSIDPVKHQKYKVTSFDVSSVVGMGYFLPRDIYEGNTGLMMLRVDDKAKTVYLNDENNQLTRLTMLDVDPVDVVKHYPYADVFGVIQCSSFAGFESKVLVVRDNLKLCLVDTSDFEQEGQVVEIGN